MLANETSFKRGAAMALMAALLQALIAIVLVGAAGFVFQATASQMTYAADWIELAEPSQRRGHWRLAGLAKGLSTRCGAE